MSGKMARNKGARWQGACRKAAAELLGLDIKATTAGVSEDDIRIPEHSLSIECKNVASTSVGAWLRQAKDNAPHGFLPLVWHHRPGKADPLDGFITISARDFLAWIKENP